MLYKDFKEYESFGEEDKVDYLFDAVAYNEYINVGDVAALEEFYNKYHYLPLEHIPMFLNWVVFYIRCSVVNPLESPLCASFKGRCAPAAQVGDELLTKMGFKVEQFNMGSVVNAPQIHQLTMVYIPTIVDDKVVNKKYILDPTFRQFCISEENRFERYFEEPRYSVNMATPRPGYFMNLTADGRRFANELITYGYFEITEPKLKRYSDAFALYAKPKEKYKALELVGTTDTTNTTANEYMDRIIENPYMSSFHMRTPVITALEQVKAERKKFFNTLKRIFFRIDKYKQTIDLDNKN